MKKNRLLTLAGLLALLAILGKFYTEPLLAQVRAALVSDVDNPARGFVQFHAFVHLPPANAGTSLTADLGYQVPAGKRLVVDTVSAMSQQLNQTRPSGGLWLLAGASGACSPTTVAFGVTFGSPVLIMPLTFQGTTVFGDYSFGAIQHVQAYVDSGQCLAVRIDHDATVDTSVSYNVTVSGHVVSLP